MSSTNTDLAPRSDIKERDSGARRTRLREFQSQLVERMAAAASGTAAQASQLGIMIGNTRWLLNLQEAGEIVSVGTITKVPLTQEWYLGLTNIRGNLISVIDIARFRGLPPTPIDKESRIVAFSPSLAFNAGLLVSRVMGLRNVSDMELQPPAETGDVPWAVQRYLDRESQLWTELDLSQIVQDQEFLHVGI